MRSRCQVLCYACLWRLSVTRSPLSSFSFSFSFFFNTPAPTEIYTLSLHDALPISSTRPCRRSAPFRPRRCSVAVSSARSEEHTSELQSLTNLVCRLLLEKKKTRSQQTQNSRGEPLSSLSCVDGVCCVDTVALGRT